jgi:hypothetical protein
MTLHQIHLHLLILDILLLHKLINILFLHHLLLHLQQKNKPHPLHLPQQLNIVLF